MVAQTNHQLSYYAMENKVEMMICLRMGKISKAKTPPSEFKVRIHYYHNKRLQVKESQYFLPIYS